MVAQLIGVVRESTVGETRVAATPTTVRQLISLGYRVAVEASARDTVRAAAVAARDAAEGTRSMLARRGRASYSGERSIGTLDAGAVAVAVILEALADQWPDA